MTRFLACLVLLFAAPALADHQCSPVCDIDGDGVSVTQDDYMALLQSLRKARGQEGFNPNADLDNSGTVTLLDWGLLNQFCPLGQ